MNIGVLLDKFFFRQFKSGRSCFTNESIFKIIPVGLLCLLIINIGVSISLIEPLDVYWGLNQANQTIW